MKILERDIYEISSETDTLVGVKLRGRIRKFCLKNDITILLDNATDNIGAVRFGVLTGCDVIVIRKFIESIIKNPSIRLVLGGIKNPVLSKLNVNDETRYEI